MTDVHADNLRKAAERFVSDAEEWRAIPDYESNYEVNSEGRVRSRRRKGAPGGVIAQQLDASSGYSSVGLYSNGRSTTHKVHQLVAAAFLGPQPKGLQVRHLDGNPTHSAVTNLAYGTPAENQWDRVAHGRHFNANKTHCPQGHEYTQANTYTLPSRPRTRYCRKCKTIDQRARRRGQAAPAPTEAAIAVGAVASDG
jgi:hypothetical protein